MVIDTSALIAILWREPEEAAFRTVIKLAPNRLLGTASWVECGDGFSHALAKAAGEALLFKGGDFSRTDIRPAA